MDILKFFRVTELPEALQPSSIYLSKDPSSGIVTIYLTGNTPDVICRTVNNDDVIDVLTTLLTGAKNQPNGLASIEEDGYINDAYIKGLSQLKQNIIDSASGNGFVNQDDTLFDFENITRTFTIIPANDSYNVYVKGKCFTKSNVINVTIDDIDGLWFIYFDSNGAIQASQTEWDIISTAPIVSLYWNKTKAQMQFICEERHSCAMDVETHTYLHQTVGTAYKSGLIAGDYTTSGTGNDNSDVKLSITNGSIVDEDISIDINHAINPINSFEQTLTPVAKLPLMYREGQSWVKLAATDYPAKKVNTRLGYNNPNSGDWNITEAPDGSFVTMFIVATNAINLPIVSIMGQRTDVTLDDAKLNNDIDTLNWGNKPFTEFKSLYKVIFETKNTFTNALGARIVSVTDLRTAKTITISPNTGIPHSDTLFLSADDHLQYVHKAIARTITAQHTFNPTAVMPAFILGTNALDQLIAGLNAEKLNGFTAAQLTGIEYRGSVIQASGTTIIPADNTAPLVTEGSQLWSKTVTPSDIESEFTIDFSGVVDSGSNNRVVIVALFRNNTCIGVAPVGISGNSGVRPSNFALCIHDKPNTLSPVAYSCRIGIDSSGNTWYFGRTQADTFGGVNHPGWTIKEHV